MVPKRIFLIDHIGGSDDAESSDDDSCSDACGLI
jgi:hypothetical protein